MYPIDTFLIFPFHSLSSVMALGIVLIGAGVLEASFEN